jgi:thiol-disulfide isomerase/thioredoxin
LTFAFLTLLFQPLRGESNKSKSNQLKHDLEMAEEAAAGSLPADDLMFYFSETCPFTQRVLPEVECLQQCAPNVLSFFYLYFLLVFFYI